MVKQLVFVPSRDINHVLEGSSFWVRLRRRAILSMQCLITLESLSWFPCNAFVLWFCDVMNLFMVVIRFDLNPKPNNNRDWSLFYENRIFSPLRYYDVLIRRTHNPSLFILAFLSWKYQDDKMIIYFHWKIPQTCSWKWRRFDFCQNVTLDFSKQQLYFLSQRSSIFYDENFPCCSQFLAWWH